MNQTDIAPLARRLAEENNVDWRRLRGSGEGGRVVERDVLEFLAKVMAGEEALDPTPEPLPEGMQAWPEEDVNAYRAGRPTPPLEDASGDEDLFLLDDQPQPFEEPAAVVEAVVETVQEQVVSFAEEAVVDLEGDLLLAEDGPEPLAAWAGGSATAAAGGEDDLLLVDDAVDSISFQADAVIEAVPSASPADGAYQLDLTAEEDDLPDLFASGELMVPQATEPPPVFLDGPGDDPVVQDLDASDEDLAFEIEGLGVAVEEAQQSESAEVASQVPPPAAHLTAVALATELSWVRHGQLWRRRLDDRPLRAAAAEVATVLGVSSETATQALLARAASKAAMSDGPVDAWSWREDGPELRRLGAGGSLRETVEGSFAPDDAAEVAGLVVADLSPLGMDEAVLHLEAPLLALGRAGADQAWLSLSGDEVPPAAVNALASVAELLAKPIRLLL